MCNRCVPDWEVWQTPPPADPRLFGQLTNSSFAWSSDRYVWHMAFTMRGIAAAYGTGLAGFVGLFIGVWAVMLFFLA